MAISKAFLQSRITNTEAIIIALEAALLAFATNTGLQSYTLDTGQTRQTVTRYDISSMKNTLNSQYNLLAVLCARRNGAVTVVRPAF